MTMIIYHMPGSCSRVALVALEALDLRYDDRTVSLLAGAQRSPSYLAVNVKAKVPVLVDGGEFITELPVILYHLAARYPESGLLPLDPERKPKLIALSDLVWLAGALHPVAARIFRPSAITSECADEVKSSALAQLSDLAGMVAARVGDRWWYGQNWSIVDAFAAWIFHVAARSGFPLSGHPLVAAHLARAESVPAFSRAIAVEQAAITRDDLPMLPGFAI